MTGRARLQLARRKYGRSKYRNRKETCDGITFDSQREAQRYRELKMLERAGKIAHLELQPEFPIAIAGVPIKYPSGRQVRYVADFRYIERGRVVVEDVKGTRTPAYKLKKALMSTMGIEIREV